MARLLSLPPEIHLVIYNELFPENDDLVPECCAGMRPTSTHNRERPLPPNVRLAFFLTCRLIWLECRALAIRQTTFHLKTSPYEIRIKGPLEEGPIMRLDFRLNPPTPPAGLATATRSSRASH